MSTVRFIDTKDPNAILDWSISWARWLKVGQSITSATWVVPPGITMENSSLVTPVTTIRLSGGTAGEVYDIVVRVTSSDGQKDDATLQITVEES